VIASVLVASLAGVQPFGGVAAARPRTIAAAGDIACPRHPCAAQRQTTRIIRHVDPRAVLPLGDNQYPRGSLSSYRRSYARTWGEFRRRSYPVPGNHEYHTRRARGYFRYFKRRAHGPEGYYSYNLGGWHLIALNSERRKRRQTRWLRRDLRRDGHRCELAYWHQPRWSSGREHGGTAAVAGWWKILYRRGADVVLSGHEHNYERFARLSPRGRSRANGVRQFVVGTGGYYLYGFGRAARASQRRVVKHGVLVMHLGSTAYRWRFLTAGGGAADDGRTECHR
jgi:calcineurin-like phosphoesterase family protein